MSQTASSTHTNCNTSRTKNDEKVSSMYGGSKTKLIVNYLPQFMPQEEIFGIFSAIGHIESFNLVREPLTGRPLGYAFVNYYSPENAYTAMNTLNGLRLQNKTIKISYARPSSTAIKDANLHVSGLPTNITEEDLHEIFSSFGDIITLRILRNDVTGISKGVGFVRFDQRLQAEAAIEKLDRTVLEGFTEPIRIRFANHGYCINRNLQYLATPQYPLHFGCYIYPPMLYRYDSSSKWNIFVYNLPPNADDTALWQLFGPFGAVRRVKIVRDFRSKESKGFGFVTMSHFHEAVRAIALLNGHIIGNRILQVRFKQIHNP